MLRAQELLQQRAGLVAEEYVLHLVQWGWLQGGRELTLKLVSGWYEWELPGAVPQPQVLAAVSQGEIRLADLELSTLYLMHCLALTRAAEVVLESGNLVLRWRSGQWSASHRPLAGPLRLRLKRGWMQWARSSLLGGWRSIPELDLLQQRLIGSSLKWTPPGGLQPPAPPEPLAWMICIQGLPEISHDSPRPADRVERLTVTQAPASLWFSPHGSGQAVVSQGLSYTLEPDFPGTIWLSLGDLATDLSRRQLVLDDRFRQQREGALQLLVTALDRLGEERLADLKEWQWACLLQPRLPSVVAEWLKSKPLLPSFFHGTLSLRQLDEAVAAAGCCLYAAADKATAVDRTDLPVILVAQPREGWLDWLRGCYLNTEEATAVLQRCQLQIRQIPMEQRTLNTPYQRPLAWAHWKGRVGFDPEGRGSRLELGRQGVLLGVMEQGAAPRGFQFILEHPDFEWNPLQERPEGPLLQELRQWIRQQLVGWAVEACREVAPDKLHSTLLDLIKIPDVHLSAAGDIPLWGEGFTLIRLLEDARRGDLRDWVEAGVELQGAPLIYLHRFLDAEQLHQISEATSGYAWAWSTWRTQRLEAPQESTQQPPSLRLIEGSKTPGIFLMREGCVIHRTRLSEELQGSELELWADHPGFRLNADASSIDNNCAGMAWFHLEAPRFITQHLTEKLQGKEGDGLEQGLGVYPAYLWPRHIRLARRLNGESVCVADLVAASESQEVCSVLVEPVATRPLPGFEKSWLLDRAQRQKILKLFPKVRLQNDTEAYHKAYAAHRSEASAEETSGPPDTEHWIAVATFERGTFRARAGLEQVTGSLDHCPTLFHRNGRTAMQARLQLAPRSELTCSYRLVCQVDWPELPFCEEYSQFAALLEIQLLILWLRRFGAGPEVPQAYTLARLDMEAQILPPTQWKARPDAVRESWWSTPFLSDAQGRRWSLEELQERVDCAYSLTKVCREPDSFPLEPATLERLRRWLPEVIWRLESEKSPQQRALEKLRQQPRVPLQLEKAHYLLMGCDGPFDCHWGILPPHQQPSQLRIWYQGRKLEAISLDWPFAARVALPLEELKLTLRGELSLEGWLEDKLRAIRSWLEAKLLEPAARELYLLYWLSLDTRPAEAEEWLGCSLWEDPWGRSWSPLDWLNSGPKPRPCLRKGLTLPPDFSPQPLVYLSQRQIELATQLKLAEDLSEDLMEVEDALRMAPVMATPESDFTLCGSGFRLFSSLRWSPSATLTTLTGQVLESVEHHYFPPYLLELQLEARLPLSRPVLPLEAFEQLGNWWEQQLQQPLSELGWLSSFELALREAEPWEGAEGLLWLARRRLQEWFSQQLGDWELLESCLEHCLTGPWQLRLADEGPPLQIDEGPQGTTLYIYPDHPLLLHRTPQERVAYWVTRACMELPGTSLAAQILARL